MKSLIYKRVREIPSALSELSSQDLASVIRARLQGETAGLPAPNRDEDSRDILLYAFDKGSEELKTNFRLALDLLLSNLLKGVQCQSGPALQGQRDFVEGLCSLISYADLRGARQHLPSLLACVPPESHGDMSAVILGCISSLVGPEDRNFVPFFNQMLADPELCGLAFQALFRINRVVASHSVGKLLETLELLSAEEATSSLGRIFTAVLGPLISEEQVNFLRDVEEGLVRSSALPWNELAGRLLEGLNLSWAISPEALQYTRKHWSAASTARTSSPYRRETPIFYHFSYSGSPKKKSYQSRTSRRRQLSKTA